MNDRFKFKAVLHQNKYEEYQLEEFSHQRVFDVISINLGIEYSTIEIIAEYPNGDLAVREIDDKDIDLIQCTGLKDKNGKLIYEGDIINDKSNHIRVVVCEQDGFKYPALKTSRYFHKPISNKLEERKVDLRGKLTFQDNVCKCDKKHFEVIGNIYENKELLEC